MEGSCEEWKPWSRFFVLQWAIYVFFAVCSSSPTRIILCSYLFQALLSLTAAHLVKVFARYAAGSGISEIKCILAGFVMKGYLGGWTFFIKSLTLVIFLNFLLIS